MVAIDLRRRSPILEPARHESLAWVENGILVYGPRKAGTTLFQNLLDGGDEMLAYPAELKLKYFSRKLLSTKTARVYLAHSRVPAVESPHLSVTGYWSIWSQLTDNNRRHHVADLARFDAYALATALDALPSRLSRWCAKEVGGGRQDVVAYWRGLFPGTKALFIVRDPYAVLSAIIRDRHKKQRPPDQREVLRQVFDVFRTLRRQASYLDDPSVHFTVYERLTEDPVREMRRVTDFLDLPWSPVHTHPTLFGDPVVVRTASRQGAGVFRHGETWREGLSDSEQTFVDRAMRWIRLAPGVALDYSRLVDQIARRQERAG